VAHIRSKSISVRQKTLWMRFDSIKVLNNFLMPIVCLFFVLALYAVSITFN